MVQIRVANSSELPWINRCYHEIGFQPSDCSRELIAIAEIDGEPAGLGRLVTVTPDQLELGGIYTFESFRNRGVAKAIVSYLLTHVKANQAVYCIPFCHLVPFYTGYGFVPCTTTDDIPEQILEKVTWCSQTYSQTTSLLQLELVD
jgi:GNAT superfamily N-acetyltransferase